MLFNSYIFILLFFPATLFLYFGFNHFKKYELAKIVLIILSLVFYAYFNVWYLGVIVASILANFVFSKFILSATKGKKAVLTIGIIANVAVIFYFKYFDFFISNINLLFKSSIPLLQVVMPLGISFFTFQQISYLVDSYRGETADYSFVDYALFVSFFPQLIAGPIVSHREMMPQFSDVSLKSINQEKFARGLYLFAVGLAKKVLLADTIAKGVDWGYANFEGFGSFNLIILALMYSFQLYFDFSGYCDMACGIANCFNIDLPVNFLSPYRAASIGDFWKRWHITLTRFLTEYVYIPLGGSRKGKTRALTNIFIVFLVSGLWHGANWTFVVWGIMHGIAMIVYRLTSKWWDKIFKPMRTLLTFTFVSVAWIPFRADNLSQTWKIIGTIFSRPVFSLNAGFCEAYRIFEFTYVEEHLSFLQNLVQRVPSLYMWIIFAISVLIVFGVKNRHEKTFIPGLLNGLITSGLIVWSVLSLSGISTFLYFNF